MSYANVSKRLQQTIVAYSALGMFVVGVTVGLVGVLPLAQRLREAEKRNLLVDLQRQTVAVEQFLARARNSATYMAARSRTREKLEAYHQGDMTLDEYVLAATPLLREPMVLGTNIAGLTVFDLRSNLLVQVGIPIPPEHRPWPDPNSREVSLHGPLRLGEETFLVTSATAMGTNQTPIGTVMVLYRARGLQEIVEDYRDLGRSGETVLGSRQNKNLPIFFPLRRTKADAPPD